MNISTQTFSALLLALATTFSFMVPGGVAAQSNVSTASIAPVILPLLASSTNMDKLEFAPVERESYAANYPGGQAQLEAFLQANVVYPELARDNNFEGTTIIRFNVLADGSLGEYSVQQSTHDICDQAVIAALREMKQWEPAKLYGKKVASWGSVSVNFKLAL